MARHRITKEQQAEVFTEDRSSMGLDFEDFVGKTKTKRKDEKFKRIPRSRMERELKETRDLVKAAGEDAAKWKTFKPKHFVWLYAHLHETIYGALPLELLENYQLACLAAGRCIREFGGDVEKALDFVRWTWRREKAVHPTRTSDFRVGWRYQFTSAALMTDYRIFLSKQKPGKQG